LWQPAGQWALKARKAALEKFNHSRIALSEGNCWDVVKYIQKKLILPGD
jgi:hypothetical protein